MRSSIILYEVTCEDACCQICTLGYVKESPAYVLQRCGQILGT